MNIRPAVSDDCAAIARVQVATWNASYRGIVSDAFIDAFTVEARTKAWSGWFARPEPAPLSVATLSGTEIVGFSSAGPTRDDVLQADAEIYSIYVLPEAQGKGVGRALMAAGAKALAGARLNALGVWVLAANAPARAFYERLGGKCEGEKFADHAGVPLREVGYVWPRLDASMFD